MVSVLLSLLLTLRTLARSRAALRFEILTSRHQLAGATIGAPYALAWAITRRWYCVAMSFKTGLLTGYSWR
jgi:hypothetical protein